MFDRVNLFRIMLWPSIEVPKWAEKLADIPVSVYSSCLESKLFLIDMIDDDERYLPVPCAPQIQEQPKNSQCHSLLIGFQVTHAALLSAWKVFKGITAGGKRDGPCLAALWGWLGLDSGWPFSTARWCQLLDSGCVAASQMFKWPC